MSLRNRIHNCANPYQGAAKKVLCICSAGLLRSPTAANVIHKKYGHNTRSAGITPDYALIPVDEVLLTWADEIVCMEDWQLQAVRTMIDQYDLNTPHYCLSVPDEFAFMDPQLQALILDAYKEQTND